MASDNHDRARTGLPKPRFIPGVHNYCDHWCERCRYQTRCRLFRDMRRHEAATNDEALSDLMADEDDVEDSRGEGSENDRAERAAWLVELEELNRPPSPEEIEADAAAWEKRHRDRTAHPLSVAAAEYAEMAVGITAALRSMLEPAGDALVVAALDTIDRFAYFSSVKIWRAVGSLVDDDPDEFARDDGNGCAKLVRLVLAESRGAWAVLMQAGLAVADGVPAAMVRRLETLDAGLAAAFPQAMAFVRPGLDEGP